MCSNLPTRAIYYIVTIDVPSLCTLILDPGGAPSRFHTHLQLGPGEVKGGWNLPIRFGIFSVAVHANPGVLDVRQK